MKFAKLFVCFWLTFSLLVPALIFASETKISDASLFLKQKKYRAALEVLEQLESRSPSNFEIKGKMVSAYMGLGENDAAEIKVQEILALKPDNAKAEFILGSLYLRKGKFQEAEKLFLGVEKKILEIGWQSELEKK